MKSTPFALSITLSLTAVNQACMVIKPEKQTYEPIKIKETSKTTPDPS